MEGIAVTASIICGGTEATSHAPVRLASVSGNWLFAGSALSAVRCDRQYIGKGRRATTLQVVNQVELFFRGKRRTDDYTSLALE